nr:YwgA family protein [Thalassobacillus pellis]
MHFFASSGEIIGRKKLQKIIYILKKCEVPFEERFQFHFYGPYSEELTLRVEELCNLGFLKETKEEKKNYYQYRYLLTEAGRRFLDHYHLELPEMGEQIAEMKERSSRFLELVSTILYFEYLPHGEINEKVLSVKSKQNYTDEEMTDAWEFIRKMRGE